jgi:hypothetical protein
MTEIKIHQFDPIIYPFKIWITISNDFKSISDKFNDYPSRTEFDYKPSDKFLAFTQNVQEKSSGFVGAIIVFKTKKYCKTKLIAHESTHAARMLWDYISEHETGVEADAYLVGWISECCEKVKSSK